MSSSYTFNKTVTKQQAFESYIKSKIDWVDLYEGSSVYTDSVVVYTNQPLTEIQLSNLTTYINDYIDPEYILLFERTESMALHSHYSNDPNNVIIDNKDVLQTLIFTNRNSPDSVLDALKTIVEYKIPNVSDFLNVIPEDAHINLEIYDVTRDISITNQIIYLNEIATKWKNLAQNGSTDCDSVFRSAMFTGIMNKTPNHDCIWQIRGYVNPPEIFQYRINGLQYIFYTKQY